MPKGTGFFRRVNRMIEKSDVILEVLDARFADSTRNRLFENIIAREGKKLILVLNKCDLVSREFARSERRRLSMYRPCILLSTRMHFGARTLRETIARQSHEGDIKVCVIGYPNTGKSSLINVLAGRHAAPTAKKAGFTRGQQFVKISSRVLLVDTPGVIPIWEKDEAKLALLYVKNPQQLRDAESAAERIISLLKTQNPQALSETYGISPSAFENEPEIILELIAVARKKLRKGAEPDTHAAAQILIKDWQEGKLSANSRKPVSRNS